MIVVKSKRTGEYLVGREFEFILENFTKWAYFDDLLALETELERTRKALDVAVDAIDVISLKYHKDTPSIFLIKYAQNAKDQITALEQKERGK